MDALNILNKYWGHAHFRLKQEEIITQVVSKKDTLAILPTGGGKSICYQIPALMQDGICLVISPLIALMDDQVRFLSSKGIKSVAITSEMNYNEISTILTNCIYGNIKFLYVSPERLQSQLLKEKINVMNINLITVDEAHCISEWGHHFRPAYRRIKEIRDIIPNTPILALTATATNDVANDIQNNLNFQKHNVIKSSFLRPNISYVIDEIENKKKRLLQLAEKIKSSIIIYVNTRKAAKEISDFLNNNNYPANYIHAGIPLKTRKIRQERWHTNQTRIMVATNAFGMGINKPDVKLVIHMSPPSTIESYFQESGRAGRNGKQAYSFLLANTNDIKKTKTLFNSKYPEINIIKECYQNIANYLQIAENTLPKNPIPFNIIEFSNKYGLRAMTTYNIIKYLEKEEYLKFYESNNMPAKIKINVTNQQLYQFQISNKYYDNFIKILLRSYSDIFNNITPINETEIAKKCNLEEDEAKRLLKKLEQLEIIQYYPRTNSSQITFLQKRKDANLLHLDINLWQKRKDNEQKKLEKLIRFILTKDKCRTVLLLEYFGEKTLKECEKCDYCVKQNRKKIKEKEFARIVKLLKEILSKKECSIEEIYTRNPHLNKYLLNNILNFLFNNEKIIKFGNKYKWKVN